MAPKIPGRPKTFCQTGRLRDLVLLTETAYVVATIHFNTKYIPAWLVFHFTIWVRLSDFI